jgi:hypothetical protein
MQRINFDIFWKRYGHGEYNKNPFAEALARLPAVSAQGPWVAGGSVRRLIMDIPQDSDFDFFFASSDQLAAFKNELEAKGAKKVSENEFNITYRVPSQDKLPELKVQLIRVSYQTSLEETIKPFDFSLCQCGFDGTDLVFGQYTLFDLGRRRLVPENITYGVSSLRRMIKYIKQGYTICSGGLGTFLQQIADDPAKINADIKYID